MGLSLFVRTLEVEYKRNIELIWAINSITPDDGTIGKLVKDNRDTFHNILRNRTLISLNKARKKYVAE